MWGNDLGRSVGSKEGAESKDLYNRFFEKYEAAIKIKPDNYELLNSLGKYLAKLARSASHKFWRVIRQFKICVFAPCIEIIWCFLIVHYQWVTISLWVRLLGFFYKDKQPETPSRLLGRGTGWFNSSLFLAKFDWVNKVYDNFSKSGGKDSGSPILYCP